METKRVALSKKLRFDVFKRDGFACMYCGQTPPDVVLEAADIATIKFRWGGSKMFPYFCGVCWRMIEEAKQ